MPVSQLLVLLPPRQTAKPQIDSSSDSSGPSGDVSFAPKLQKAKEQQSTVKSSPDGSKTKASTDAAPVTDAGTAKKTNSKTTDSKISDSADPDAATALPTAAKTRIPNAVTEDAIAESTTQTDKKTTKPQKAPAKSSTPAKQTAHGVQPGEQAKARIVTPVSAAASGTGGQEGTGSPDGDDDSDAGDSADAPLSFGSGFYGSAKVVAREASVSAGDDADAAASTAGGEANAAAVASAVGDDPAAAPEAEIATDSVIEKPAASSDAHGSFANTLSALSSSPTTSGTGAGKTTAAPAPQASFVEENHPKIVDSIQGQLMPRGGTMQLQLHPADLGSVQVTVEMKDGVMSASFQTSNEAATKMLTRSLGQLKSGLEAAGMSVEKLHVEQTTQGDAKSGTGDSSGQAAQDQQQQARQDQQRRELVKQMWKKLSGGDPLDLVA